MILAKVCPSCLAHAENKKAAARRKARFTCVSHPPALSKTETNREGARAKRILGLHRRLLQFFPCTGKNLRVHSHLPACSDPDRKSTRLNSSHGYISYAVFCLKKKTTTITDDLSTIHAL